MAMTHAVLKQETDSLYWTAETAPGSGINAEWGNEIIALDDLCGQGWVVIGVVPTDRPPGSVQCRRSVAFYLAHEDEKELPIGKIGDAVTIGDATRLAAREAILARLGRWFDGDDVLAGDDDMSRDTLIALIRAAISERGTGFPGPMSPSTEDHGR